MVAVSNWRHIMATKRRSSTQQRTKRFRWKNLLKNPMTLRWGLFLLRVVEAVNKWI